MPVARSSTFSARYFLRSAASPPFWVGGAMTSSMRDAVTLPQRAANHSGVCWSMFEAFEKAQCRLEPRERQVLDMLDLLPFAEAFSRALEAFDFGIEFGDLFCADVFAGGVGIFAFGHEVEQCNGNVALGIGLG